MYGAVVYLYCGVLAVEVVLVNAVLVAQRLKLAAAASYAGKTFLLVVGEDKLEGRSAALYYLGGVGEYLHTLVYGVNARSNKASCALYLNNADTARADCVDVLEIAKSGYLYAGDSGSLEDSGTLGNGTGNAVYLNVDHVFSPFLSYRKQACRPFTPWR